MRVMFSSILEFVNAVIFGPFARWGEPDPTEMRREQELRREQNRRALGQLVGGLGTALTPLRPLGKISLDGRVYEATSEAYYIDRGTQVVAIGGRGSALIVRAKSPSIEAGNGETRSDVE